MKRKKKRYDFRNAITARQNAIKGGDRLLARADALAFESTTNPKRGRQKLREAALFYEGAARAYQRASLVLLAKKNWGRAQDCYEQLNDSLLVTRSQEQIDAIDDIWVGDDTKQM